MTTTLSSQPARSPASPLASQPAPVIQLVQCVHCRGAVQLECAGLAGFWGYKTYNEYACPHCRKQNHQQTAGAIVSARAAVDRP